MIHDLQKYRADRWNPVAAYFNFWFNAWTMFMPALKIEAKIYTFPRAREPKP